MASPLAAAPEGPGAAARSGSMTSAVCSLALGPPPVTSDARDSSVSWLAISASKPPSSQRPPQPGHASPTPGADSGTSSRETHRGHGRAAVRSDGAAVGDTVNGDSASAIERASGAGASAQTPPHPRHASKPDSPPATGSRSRWQRGQEIIGRTSRQHTAAAHRAWAGRAESERSRPGSRLSGCPVRSAPQARRARTGAPHRASQRRRAPTCARSTRPRPHPMGATSTPPAARGGS